MSKKLLWLLTLSAIVIMFVSGMSIKISSSAGSYFIYVASSPLLIISFILAISALVLTYQKNGIKLDTSKRPGVFMKILSFILDILLWFILVGFPLSIIALILEFNRTKEFQWNFMRGIRFPTDIVMEVGITASVIWFIVLMVLRGRKKVTTIGQFLTYPNK